MYDVKPDSPERQAQIHEHAHQKEMAKADRAHKTTLATIIAQQNVIRGSPIQWWMTWGVPVCLVTSRYMGWM